MVITYDSILSHGFVAPPRFPTPALGDATALQSPAAEAQVSWLGLQIWCEETHHNFLSFWFSFLVMVSQKYHIHIRTHLGFCGSVAAKF